MTASRYPLGGPDRELQVTQRSGLVLISVVDRLRSGACTSGPLAVRPEDLATLKSALADLLGETGQTEASP